MVRTRARPVLFGVLALALVLKGSSPSLFSEGRRALASAAGIKMKFTAEVAAPTRMTVCGGRLWAYDHASRQLVSLDLADGRILGRHDLALGRKFTHLSALACSENALLLGVETSENTDKQPAQSALVQVASTGAPALIPDKGQQIAVKGRIDDILCGSTGCYLLNAGALMRWTGSGLKSISLPTLRDIPHRQTHTQDNPFSGWSDYHIAAEGRLTRGRLGPKGQLILLDPFRANVVTVSFEKGGVQAARFGRWGIWEGSLMLPKAVQPLAGGILAVSDTGLRTVSLLRDDGAYAGRLPHEFEWPLDVVANPAGGGRTLYVSDLKAGKILAFEFAKEWDAAPILSDDIVRANLFRRETRMKTAPHERCLACHDGTVTDEWDHFAAKNRTHPVDVKQKTPGELPLDPEGLMSCLSCHDPHHGTTVEGADGPRAELQRPFLRKRPPALCMDCHGDHGTKGKNHPMGPGLTCVKCHDIHGAAGGRLVPTKDRLCLDCHKPQAYRHKIVDAVLETERAKLLRFENGLISCTTCHKPHLSEGKHILRAGEPLQQFCASCHGEKTPQLFKDFHKRIRTRGERWTQ